MRPVALALVAVLLLPYVPEALAANPTWRVFATREGLVGQTTANGHVITNRDHFVALPSRDALTCNGCYAKQVRVCNPANGRCETAPVWDVGPWNTKDDWWNSPRAMFNDLPRGKPEAQAAYYEGYNGGKDMFGRTVLNPAGIDLADGTFWDGLGMSNNGWVDVTFLWIDIPAGDTSPPSTPAISEQHTGPAWSAHGSPLWTWSSGDAQSGIARYELQPSWGGAFLTTATSWHPTLPTGEWSVRVRAQNGAGLWSGWSATIVARIDVSPPAAPVVAEDHAGAGSAGGWTRHVDPRFAWPPAADAGSGVQRYLATLDGVERDLGGTREDHPMLAEGVHAWNVLAVDGVGQRSGPSSAFTLRVDLTAPTLDVPSPPADGVLVGTEPTPIEVAATDALSGVARVDLLIDGTWRATLGPSATWWWHSANEAAGDHRVELRAYDRAGNVATLERWVTTVPASEAGARATLAAAQDPPVVGAYADCPGEVPGSCEAGVETDGRRRGVEAG